MRVTLGTFKATPELHEMIWEILNEGRLSYGPYSQELERRFSILCKHRYGVLSNSGTSSLVVALLAMKEKYGWGTFSEVIVPATTFVASYNSIVHAGLKPVLVDIDSKSWDFGPDAIRSVSTENTVAVMTVNLFGKPSQLRSIKNACDVLGLKMIEDSCEAVGALHHGQSVGSYGDISVFSFYMAHILTAGVGGISVTSDEELALLMRSYVNHGLSIKSLSPHDYDAGFLGRRFIFDRIGHSYRITELEAAIALNELNRLDWIVERRNEVASLYNEFLSQEIAQHRIQVAHVGEFDTSSWMMYPFVINEDMKYNILYGLREADIEARDMVPLTNQPCYRGRIFGEYPVAHWINNHGVYVGCHENMTAEEVQYVTDVIKENLPNGRVRATTQRAVV